MPEVLNTTAATPERVAATEALTQALISTVKASSPSDGRVVLDALLSTYVTTVIRSGQQHIPAAMHGLASVRTVLLAALHEDNSNPDAQVRTLANLVLIPDLVNVDHAIGLSALLSVYRDLLRRFPCCQESHAVQLFAMWQQASAGAAAADTQKPTTH